MVADNRTLKESPAQTAGPYVHIGCMPNLYGINGVYSCDLGASMVNDATVGERITVTGRVFDGAREPLKDALVEIWQADANGVYASSLFKSTEGTKQKNCIDSFVGWGRQACDAMTGRFIFETIKPGQVPVAGGGFQAPHISFWIVARGINLGLNTRLYFPDEDNSDDPVLSQIDKERRGALISAKDDENYIFDICIQGESETVFFDI